MDIIEQAYTDGDLRHWDDLCNWLRTHAKNVNDTDDIMEAAQAAIRDGRIFPDSPEVAKDVIKKYRWTENRFH